MRILTMSVALAAVGFCFSLIAETPKPTQELKDAQSQFDAALAKEQAEHDKAVNKLKLEHKKALEIILKTQTKAGNLDAALLVRDKIKSLESVTPVKPGRADSQPSPTKWIAGTWAIKYHPNKIIRKYLISSDGKVSFNEAKQNGQLKINGESLLLDFADGKIEQLRFVGNRLYVEHYDPSRALADNNPAQIGIGVLETK